jgi:class 3 adenylate cyclase
MDFTNKALEALDRAGWENAAEVLPSLAVGYANASRSEESNQWRHPVDLIVLLETAFEKLAAAVEEGRPGNGHWEEPEDLVGVLLAEDPALSIEALLEQLRRGATIPELAVVVTHAAALRIAQFATTNEFSDWDTALHTFTFANAVHHASRRQASLELLRGVFDAAMAVYLDRFLNIPPVRVPRFEQDGSDPAETLAALPGLLDQQQQVNESAELIARYLDNGGELGPLVSLVGKLLVREDRDFHTIQAVEAAISGLPFATTPERTKNLMVAAIRYLAAHAPTVRAAEQTFQIAHRLAQGERLYEDVESMVTTVLYTDIVGSTRRATELGDRRWRDLLERHNTVVREDIRRFGGRELNFTGDGFLAAFERPTRAIKCATAIVDSMSGLGIEVRAGLHTGECEVRGDDVHGVAFHIGARVAALAGAREVLVTSTVRELVAGSGIKLEDRGLQTLKGVDGEVQVFVVAR